MIYVWICKQYIYVYIYIYIHLYNVHIYIYTLYIHTSKVDGWATRLKNIRLDYYPK